MENGVHVNRVHKSTGPYLRISAGPLRGKYVHILVAEGMLGRALTPEETVEHKDGNGLNPNWQNLVVVTRPENTRLMHERRKRERSEC